MKGDECKVCTYDNPGTQRRECWQNGRLLCFYSAEVLLSKQPPRGNSLFFGANVGDWNPGQLVGDASAMPNCTALAAPIQVGGQS